MPATFTENRLVTMETETCCVCGVLFAMTREYRQKRIEDHDLSFHCPNGHSQIYTGKTPAQKLQDALDEERRNSNNLRAARDAAQEQARHSSIERRKVQTRLRHLKERVKNGVCPCCHRQFPALAAHIRQEHPGYVVEQD